MMKDINLYEYAFKYSTYLIETSYDQELTLNYISNCVINEDDESGVSKVVSTFKTLAGKFVNMIKKLWGMFIEKISSLVLSKVEYLKNYEDIIKKKKPVARTIDVENWYAGKNFENLQKIINLKIPAFDFNQMKEIFLKESKEEAHAAFIQRYLTNYKVDKDESLKEKIMETYFIESDEIKGSTLNMPNLYKWCLNFEKIKNEIKSDEAELLRSENKIVAVIEKYSRELDEIQKKKEDQAQRKKEEEEKKKEDAKPSNESTDMKSFLEAISAGKAAVGGNDHDIQQRNAKVDKDQVKMDITSSTKNQDELTKIKQNITVYFTVFGEVLSAKLQMIESIMKDYMSLLKMHIKDYVKNPEGLD